MELAILKAGGAWLTIEPDCPNKRIQYMISDAKCKVILTLATCVSISDIVVIELETVNYEYKIKNLQTLNISEDLCYVIYTSGSTGASKGAMISHKNICNFCNSNHSNYFQYKIHANSHNVLGIGSFTFDISILETFFSLTNGLKVVIVSDNSKNNAYDLSRIILKHNIDTMHITPTRLSIYNKDSHFSKAISNIKIFMLGGEELSKSLCEQIKLLSKGSIFNGYGPTETTMGVSFGEIAKTDDITIGKPIANTQIYILDKHQNLMPIGAVGELCIAGDGVGSGYLNRPELTAEKFVDNPFGIGKMYKTGDLAKWRSDGNIEYIGRNDFQVKIRGLRIELGEIENVLSTCETVKQAVVVVQKDANQRQYICAFYVAESDVEIKSIRAFMGEKLPKYMIPHIFTRLEVLPMTTSGKINRKGLPKIDLENISSTTEYVAPSTEQQKELCKIMEDVLKTSPIGLADNFFDLGGDSLKAIEFVSKAHNDGIYFTLQNVFDYPTINELCDYIVNCDKTRITYNEVDFEKINPVLAQNTVANNYVPSKTKVGNILLTGATGFLGIHILAEFIEKESGTAYCLVRGKDGTDSKARLKETLTFYFDGKYIDKIDGRIITVCGDLIKDNLIDLIIPTVDTVIHTAASVKHYGSYKYFYDINVVGTKNVIKFAKRHKAKLLHVSTLSVSGNSMADQFDAYRSEEHKDFFETNLFIEQPLDNVYIRSKFEAEKAVLEAMTEGLKANILRVGNLTSRYSDAKFQKNYTENAFLGRIKAALELGLFPDYLLPLYAEFSPIDYTAEAVLKIAQYFNDRYNTFHINSHKPIYFDKFLEVLTKLNINMRIVNATEFSDKLKEIAMATDTAYIYEAFANDMDAENRLVYDSNIRLVNNFTVWYLNKLGFDWPEIDLDYLKKYFDYFRNIGYLGV